MRIVENRFLPPKQFIAINLFGVMFVKRGKAKFINERTFRHERIHTQQMNELLYVPFYLLYFVEWLVKLCFYGRKAYYHISFEREAFANDRNVDYLSIRKRFAWVKYLK